ncbi:hypothetical protein FHG87_010032 [Trinorchestia longiramus]|nr:hypothetical protein FHG87_010032 [Trinorchestia longiramus]
MRHLRNISSNGTVYLKTSWHKSHSTFFSYNKSILSLPFNTFDYLLKLNSKRNLSYKSPEEDISLTVSQETDVLSELNTASLSTLQKYGLDISTAAALHESRPITQITQLESFPGIGKEMLQQIYEKYSKASQLNLQPLRPNLSLCMPPESMMAVTVTLGCISYCHLSLSDLVPRSSSDDQSPVVKMVDLGLLPVETSDSKLHPHSLLLKVEKALSMLPAVDVYVMPNSQYSSYRRNSSALDISVKKQLAQITGMVQGHLATAPSIHSPPLYYLWDSYVHKIFGLKVIRDDVTSSLPLLHSLLRGKQVHSGLPSVQVPRLSVPQPLYKQCVGQKDNYLRTVASTVYTSIAFCALLHDTLTSTPPELK